ncbi:MAG TPA: phosphatidylserine decarboxylase family protein [Ignavibacteriaceae bacterium]|nr:phosphatidylserine decarboxylase family protein [Ignavibacteriaceae bacterium]
MFTKYGYTTLGIICIIAFIIISGSLFLNNAFLKSGIIVITIILVLLTLNFFRDPERIIPAGENLLVSPADGKVLFVKNILDNIFINGPAKQVSIFMSPLNVHVNRIPIDGTVEYLKYHEGKFIAAFKDKSSEDNERAEYGITSRYGRVFFRQVAGFIARRIIYELKLGDKAAKGERFGMIKFGSRVDVIVPEKWIEKVKKDEKVFAGETILFEYPLK